MADLDVSARSRRYFTAAAWCATGLDKSVVLDGAVRALGGTLTVKWG